jgi:hypothetical protein
MAPPCPHSFTRFTFVGLTTLVSTCRLCDLVVVVDVAQDNTEPWLQASYATPDGETPDVATTDFIDGLMRRVRDHFGRPITPPPPPPPRRFRPRQDPEHPTPEEFTEELGDDMEAVFLRDQPRQMVMSFPSIGEWDTETVVRFQEAFNARGQELGYRAEVALAENANDRRTLRLTFAYAPPATP